MLASFPGRKIRPGNEATACSERSVISAANGGIQNMISLQDLIERFQLSNDQLDASLSEEQLREAARIVADHETLGLTPR